MAWINKLFENYWVALLTLLIGFFSLINNAIDNKVIGIIGSIILTGITLHIKHRYVLYSVLGLIWILVLITIF